jgi:hypothetical protein
MPQKIYFGDVEITNIRTGEKKNVHRKLFKELDSINDVSMRNYVLKHIPAKERQLYKIVKFQFDTAKQIGETAY